MANGDLQTARKQLEEILGGPIGAPAEIPGTINVSGREFLYISCGPNLSKRKLGGLFSKVTGQVDPPIPQHGATLTENCVLTLPSGECFFGVSYKGDLEGWRKQIEQGAQLLGVQVAHVALDKLQIDDGREIALADCTVQFF